jgi:predicted NBD/HSP70 family sugar kinase
VEELYRIGNQLLQEASLPWAELEGVGVAVPGTLSHVEELIRWSRPFGWRDVPFKQLCQERWNVETDVVNDSLAGGMAAHQFEIQSPVENLVFLYLRFQDIKLDVVGIGVGLIINGQPYHGEFGAAGEIMTPVAHPLAHLARNGHVFASADEFAESVQSGQPESVDAMNKVAAELAPLVRHTINLLEPGVLMLGSDMPSLRDELISALREDLDSHHLDFEQGCTELLTSALGDFGVVRGATVPTLQRLFRMPQWT